MNWYVSEWIAIGDVWKNECVRMNNLAELGELYLPGSIFIDLREDLHQLLLTRPAHGNH